MSYSDPMMFAAKAAAMSDADLFCAFHAMAIEGEPTGFQRAVLDEAELRGMITGAEAGAVVRVSGAVRGRPQDDPSA